jgi:hypothetical protein
MDPDSKANLMRELRAFVRQIGKYSFAGESFPTRSLYFNGVPIHRRLTMAFVLLVLFICGVVIPIALFYDEDVCGDSSTIENSGSAHSFTCALSRFAEYVIMYVVFTVLVFLGVKVPILLVPEILASKTYLTIYDYLGARPAFVSCDSKV